MAKLTCYSRYLLTSYFCIPVSHNEKDILGVLVLEGLVGLHRRVQLQLLHCYWLGHRLGLLWYWMVCLGTNRDHSVIFEVASKYCISDSFVDHDGYSISSKGFLPTVVDIWSSELNSPIPAHHSSLIPRMSMFTLVISYFTISNLPWFMDLIFQVPMQYCSLQHWTLLLSPVPFTTGCCFCFGSIPSFFLELFLHRSPVAYGHLLTWGVPLSVSYLFAFSYCSWGFQGKNTEVSCHSLLQWSTFCQNSPSWPVCLGWPLNSMAHSFID